MKTVILPVEIAKRELDYKLLLSSELLKSGAEVIIGMEEEVNMFFKLFPNPKYSILWNSAGSDSENKERFKSNWFGIDEEAGIIYETYDDFYQTRKSLKNIPKFTKFFTWGGEDYQYLSAISNNIVKTGSPRVDLWGQDGDKFYKNNIIQIKEQYKDFILIVTNFGTSNSYVGYQNLLSIDYYHSKDSDNIVLKESLTRDKKLIKVFFDFISNAAELEGINVVIRPHPSESNDVWNDIADNFSNVYVDDRYCLTPWIKAANLVIQNGCTSALEACVSGQEVISLVCKDDTEIDHFTSIPNKIAPNMDLDTLVSYLKCKTGPLPSYNKELLSQKVITDGLAAKNIADEILTNSEKSEFKSTLSKYVLAQLIDKFNYIYYRIKKSRRTYYFKKHSGFDVRYINEKLNMLTEQDVSVTKLSNTMVHVKKGK